jgi:hypothetical protein
MPEPDVTLEVYTCITPKHRVLASDGGSRPSPLMGLEIMRVFEGANVILKVIWGCYPFPAPKHTFVVADVNVILGVRGASGPPSGPQNYIVGTIWISNAYVKTASVYRFIHIYVYMCDNTYKNARIRFYT